MARTSIHRPPFDARHEFVVTPPAGRAALSVGGLMLMAGQRFDSGLVELRRLRQMYEARMIAVAPGSALPAERKMRPRAVGPADTTIEQLSTESSASNESPAVARPRAVSRRRLSSAA